MSTTVTYKGSTLTTVNNNTKTLKTAGKYMEGDVVLSDESVDVSQDTVTPETLMQGYTAHDKTGTLITGTATGGSGGSVTQDQDGFIVLPPDGDSGSSGGSSYTLLASNDFTFDTTSTSAVYVGTITAEYADPYKTILYIKIQDKSGKKNGYFFGTNTYWQQPIGGSQLNDYRFCNVLMTDANGNIVSTSTSQYGVYPYTPNFSSDSVSVAIRAKYNSSYSGIIDGTYSVKLYALQYPDNASPYV